MTANTKWILIVCAGVIALTWATLSRAERYQVTHYRMAPNPPGKVAQIAALIDGSGHFLCWSDSQAIGIEERCVLIPRSLPMMTCKMEAGPSGPTALLVCGRDAGI